MSQAFIAKFKYLFFCLREISDFFCVAVRLYLFIDMSLLKEQHNTCRESFYSTQNGADRAENFVKPLTPNDDYSGRTAPLNSKRCNLYIYSTNIGTEYFKHGIYSPFFSLQNAVCFKILTYLVPVLFTFYIEGVLKLKKK